jgi:hypothetical protein
MQIRAAAASALAALAWAAGLFAQGVDGPDLTATGRVVSTGNTSLVVQTEDQGQSIPFIIGTSTELPPKLAAGSRVTVHYHAVGEGRLMADRVVLGAPVTLDERGPRSGRLGGGGTPRVGSLPRGGARGRGV